MSSKLAKSIVLRRKYKWGVLRVALKKRRGRRKALQSSRITKLIIRSRKSSYKLNTPSIFESKVLNLKFRASNSGATSSNNFLVTYYKNNNLALSDISKTFSLLSLKHLSFLALNLGAIDFKLVRSSSAITESTTIYKLVSCIRPSLDHHNISSYEPVVKVSKDHNSLTLISSNSKSIWLKAMTYNMRLCEALPYGNLINSDGYLPLFTLKNNFSSLDNSTLSAKISVPKSLFIKPTSVRKIFKELSVGTNIKKFIAREKNRTFSRVPRRRRLSKARVAFITKKASKPSFRYMKNIANIVKGYQNRFYSEALHNHSSIKRSSNSSFCFNHSPINSAGHSVSSKSVLSSFISLNNHMKFDVFSASETPYPKIGLTSRTFRSFRPFLEKSMAFNQDISPWVNDAIIRFIENCSGKRALLQLSSKIEGMVDNSSKLRYKLWIQRMSYYERNLGHRFFMEEALHIIHLSFRYHDVNLFSSWLKAIITRISFWKTRSIFRFLKYVFNNYYRFLFNELSIKGLKIRLKGKISAAGNSRKRTILFRSGKGSHSQVKMKCLHDFKTITTFSGVLGFQVWLFY